MPPTPRGIVLRTMQVNTRQCTRKGQYFTVATATKEQLEHDVHESELRWFEASKPKDGRGSTRTHRRRTIVR